MNKPSARTVYFALMKMLLIALAAALFVTVAGHTTAVAKTGWSEDFDKSLARTKAEKKIMLVDFTGSDWCHICIQLDKEVFAKKEFAEYAKQNLVLMEADFPLGKEQTKEIKVQNEKLKERYEIEGFPMIIVLDADGKKLGKLGYMEGGPKAFIAELEKLKGK